MQLSTARKKIGPVNRPCDRPIDVFSIASLMFWVTSRLADQRKKAHALAADGIDVGRADVGTAVTGEVSVAQVVGKEQDYVQAARSRCQRGGERGSAHAAQKSPSV